MSRVFDLLADLLAPGASADTQGTPANPAKAAKAEHPCGLAADSAPCEGLRISAKAAQDSQLFAGVRKPANPPQSKQRRGFSQDSQLSQGGHPANASRTCRDCANRLPYGTCREPRAAGLIDGGEPFGVRWAPDGHAASCPAFTAKVRATAPDRPYRLSPAEGDAAHAEPWDDAAIARFVARVALLMRRGFSVADADDLSERLHLRDVLDDGRALCAECRHLAGRAGAWRCGNHRAAGIGPDLPADLVTTMQRCPGFTRAGG